MLGVSYYGLRLAIGPLFTLPLCAPSYVAAQEVASVATANALPDLVAGKRIFLPAYFDSDNPQTAADMVQRIPGFGIDDGDNVRGFGGAAGNVLIDGARPTSKSEGLEAILTRIPAANVEQVELLEGAAAGALAPGKTLVVNVVRKAGAKSAGNWQLEGEGVSSGRVLPGLKASYTTKLGRLNVTAGVDTEIDDVNDFVGFEGFQNPNGQYLEQGPNDDRRRRRYGQLTLGADGSFGDYKVNANASWFRGVFRRNWNHVSTRTGASLPFRVDEGRESNDETNWEIGADIEREIVGWTSKLAILSKSGNQTRGSVAGFNLIGVPKFFERFVSDALTTERLARVTFKRKFGAHQVEFGGEYAFNNLDFEGAFASGNGSVFVIRPSDISNTQVQEDRREAFISDSWTISPKLTVEATLTGEWSIISQSGDAAKERSFFYPKPRIKAVWKPQDGWTYRAEIDREVGQLDFGAFADSASVGEGNQNSGNPELRPAQTWVYRLGLERRWGTRGVFNASIVSEQIQDQLSLVPTLSGGVALGNVPEASRYGYNVSWTIPLANLLEGLEVEGAYRWRDSQMLDPLTGAQRPLSGNNGNQFNIGARYDLPKKNLKFGGWLWRGGHNLDFRPSQRFEFSTLMNWGVWVETDAIAGLTVQFGLENFGGNSVSRVRADYNPDRRSGTISRIQYRERSFDGTWYVSLKGKF